MLTNLHIRGFKLFDEVDIELAQRVVFVGPNNSGKTSALQALALWDLGAKRWLEKRGSGDIPAKRPGVTINRKDLIPVPVPATNLLWRERRTQQSQPNNRRVYIEVGVTGVHNEGVWQSNLEFYYANEESFYCRSKVDEVGGRMNVPEHVRNLRVAYLPAMSGLAAVETRLDEGAINVRLGEGRTAEVLRNLCWRICAENGDNGAHWEDIKARMSELFGITMEDPQYVAERGEITLAYRNRQDTRLDLSSGGRGQQQTLLLLAHMAVHPGSILLLDEPDAHLEILRQRQIYDILTDTAASTGSQIIAASHSEVILNEAADRDTVIAFVGRPHRIDDRGTQLAKSLKEIGWDQYLQAEERGWVIYLEGSTDLDVLRTLARRLGHPASGVLARPFVKYVGNQPRVAQQHFHGLREAKSDLQGIGIFDRLEKTLPPDSHLKLCTWRRVEIECYLCTRDVLLRYAESIGTEIFGGDSGDLLGFSTREAMEEKLSELETALRTIGEPSPWDGNLKVTDKFLDRLFENFFESLHLPNLMRKTDYHTLARFLSKDEIDPEVADKLDRIAAVARSADPGTG